MSSGLTRLFALSAAIFSLRRVPVWDLETKKKTKNNIYSLFHRLIFGEELAKSGHCITVGMGRQEGERAHGCVSGGGNKALCAVQTPQDGLSHCGQRHPVPVPKSGEPRTKEIPK